MKKSFLIFTFLCVLLAASPVHAAIVYSLDDGTRENDIGLGGESFAWANRFTVVSGGESITGMSVWFESQYYPAGSPVTLLIWGDPNNDGVPSDAVVLASLAGFSGSGFTDYTFASSVYVGPAGTNFFAGVISSATGNTSYAATIDQTSSQGQSWISLTPDLTSDPVLIDLYFPGNWMIRAQSDGGAGAIPEPATMSLIGAGLAGLVLLRRRK